MNRRQAGGVYFLPIHVLGRLPGGWRPPESLSSGGRHSETAWVESLLAEIFVATGVRTPPTTLPNEWVVPTEPAGHEDVQPPALRSILDIIVDPVGFDFSPIF